MKQLGSDGFITGRHVAPAIRKAYGIRVVYNYYVPKKKSVKVEDAAIVPKAKASTPKAEKAMIPKYKIKEKKYRETICMGAYERKDIMRHYLQQFARDQQMIEDAISDVYLRLMKEPSTLTIKMGDGSQEYKFRALLCLKAKQSLINLQRKFNHKRQMFVNPHPHLEKECYTIFDIKGSQTSVLDQFDYEFLTSELESAIATMPEEAQPALTHYFAGAEIREVCRELGMNQNVYRKIRDELVPQVQEQLKPRLRAYHTTMMH